MRVACGTAEACIGCDEGNVLASIPTNDIGAVVADVITGRPELGKASFLQLRGLVDDAYEARTEELPDIGVSTALTKAVRKISSGKCEVWSEG